LGRYPSFFAARSIRFLVVSGMYRESGALFRTIETVADAKPLSFATSRIVTAERCRFVLSSGMALSPAC
jgi:hypothetical protein